MTTPSDNGKHSDLFGTGEVHSRGQVQPKEGSDARDDSTS